MLFQFLRSTLRCIVRGDEQRCACTGAHCGADRRWRRVCDVPGPQQGLGGGCIVLRGATSRRVLCPSAAVSTFACCTRGALLNKCTASPVASECRVGAFGYGRQMRRCWLGGAGPGGRCCQERCTSTWWRSCCRHRHRMPRPAAAVCPRLHDVVLPSEWFVLQIWCNRMIQDCLTSNCRPTRVICTALKQHTCGANAGGFEMVAMALQILPEPGVPSSAKVTNVKQTTVALHVLRHSKTVSQFRLPQS